MENTWRIQLKPSATSGVNFEDILKFCIEEQIIGVAGLKSLAQQMIGTY